MSSRTLWSAVAVVLAACGGTQTDVDAGTLAPCSPNTSLQSVTSQSGAYTVDVCDPVQPGEGFNSFAFLVVNQAGAPQDGLSLTVQPWMPYMNHGAPGNGLATVTAMGQGQYEVTNVVFQMAGEWQLRTTISAPTPDNANPQFNID